MNYLCIHSHFYQPPRENPWLESIEMQDSAYPYHDWNERITAECYYPNGAARILDDKQRIVRIVNNYASISYNVGPTLLSWLEEKSPDAYALILDADCESARRLGGHGNAIAQVYNHLIMPLANRRDKITQIRWGIEDFHKRFGRKPEGMWLAETAVDLESLDLMAEQGIRFTILSPYQAKTPIDPTQPYIVKLPSGRTITVFFYNGPVSQAVAFERLLEDGERFAQRLGHGFNAASTYPDQLAHIATDGETYGHHHRHGEMALSYAVQQIESGDQVKITNYAAYLAAHPPVLVAEIHENSAWSCSHGVGRWKEDCGCNSGGRWGWHQAWRGPLREAYDWLRDAMAPEFETRAGQFAADPWAARDGYIDVVLDRSSACVDAFLSRYAKRQLTPAERIEFLKLLEMQRNAMLMYTSCGWFFDDLSGIETVQTMHYAGRALQLFEEVTGIAIQEAFLEKMARAVSNVRELGNGADIFRTQVLAAKVDFDKLAAHYAISSLFTNYPENAPVYCFQCLSTHRRESRAGRLRVVTGTLTITSRITGESAEYAYGVVHFGDHNLTAAVLPLTDKQWYTAAETQVHETFENADIPELIRLLDREWGGTSSLTLKSLLGDEQRRITNDLLDASIEEAEGAFRRLYQQNQPLVRFVGKLKMPLPGVFQTISRTAVNTMLKRALSAPMPDAKLIASLLDEAAASGIELDSTTLEYRLRKRINRAAKEFARMPQSLELLEHLLAWTRVRPLLPFQVHPWSAQNRCYAVYQSTYPSMRKAHQKGDNQAGAWVEHFRELCLDLGILVQD